MTQGNIRAKMSMVMGVTALLATTAACGARDIGRGDSGENENYEITFSHIHPPGTSKALAVEKFKEVVEAESGGKISVEVFGGGELYSDEDGLQALQAGSVQMLAPAAGILTAIAPPLGVLDLPYLLEPGETLADVIKPGSNLEDAIYNNQDLSKSKIKVLSLWDYGFKQLWSNKAVRTLADLEGQKLRIYGGSTVLKDQMEVWGANPNPMALGEVYSAIQQGTIDGFENGYVTVEALKAHEVLKYATLTNHGYNSFAVIINNEFFESLPSDLQDAVTVGVEESTAYNLGIQLEIDNESREVIEAAGTTEFIELSAEENARLREKVLPAVWAMNADDIGQEVIDELSVRASK